jgi:hypothetical protein
VTEKDQPDGGVTPTPKAAVHPGGMSMSNDSTDWVLAPGHGASAEPQLVTTNVTGLPPTLTVLTSVCTVNHLVAVVATATDADPTETRRASTLAATVADAVRLRVICIVSSEGAARQPNRVLESSRLTAVRDKHITKISTYG